jgi:hypothetical protein
VASSRILWPKLGRLANVVTNILLWHCRVGATVLNVGHGVEGHLLHASLVSVPEILRRAHILVSVPKSQCLHVVSLLGELLHQQRMRERSSGLALRTDRAA